MKDSLENAKKTMELSGDIYTITTAHDDILVRMGLNSNIWLDEIKYFDKWYYKAIGTVDSLKKYCKSIQQQWIKGLARKPRVLES